MALRLRIREIAQVRVRYGYRKIRVLLNREGWKVGKKLVYRLSKSCVSSAMPSNDCVDNRSICEQPDSGFRLMKAGPLKTLDQGRFVNAPLPNAVLFTKGDIVSDDRTAHSRAVRGRIDCSQASA